MESFTERREYPRINTRFEFRIESDGKVLTAEAINLSCSGVYCRVNRLVPLMTNLRLVFALIYGNEENEVEYVECEGMVVRVEEVVPEDNVYHIAIFFNEIEENEREKIRNFIESEYRNPNVGI